MRIWQWVTMATLLAPLLVALPSQAHKPSDSYLSLHLQGARIAGRWDIALRDLDHALDLDRDEDGAIRWGEVRARQLEIGAYVRSRLKLAADGRACPSQDDKYEIVRHSDGTYLVVWFSAECGSVPRRLTIRYELFFEQDPQHRGLVRVTDARETRALIFSSGERDRELELTQPQRPSAWVAVIGHGIRHIWSGWDHLLFLIALLLPSVLRREASGWQPLIGWRPALKDVVRIATAFTVAHSLTLSMAALGIVQLPSRLVEAGIAASVVLAALNNVYPLLRSERWAAAFVLGLLHGFGFSATLVDLGLPRHALLRTLLGFNLGVELGQLAIVAALFPLAYLARRTVGYRRIALFGGSLATAAVGAVWFAQRALGS